MKENGTSYVTFPVSSWTCFGTGAGITASSGHQCCNICYTGREVGTSRRCAMWKKSAKLIFCVL